MKLKLKVWRQAGPNTSGAFQEIMADDVSEDSSFLEMLDLVNDQLELGGKEPIHFDHDCREGICGACSLVINGIPHGPDKGTATCQLHMRSFKDGDEIWVEPWRAKAFPVLKDLMVDRSSLDRIVQVGGYISISTGNAPDAHAMPIEKEKAETAFDAAACIGCGACVAACKNASAMLFVGAKVTHLNSLPQGKPEELIRANRMITQMDIEGFGGCTNTTDCEGACPKEIKMSNITKMNFDFIRSILTLKDYSR